MKNHREANAQRFSRSCSSTSGHQGNHLPITQEQINADHQEAQSEEELLQGLILQEWYQGDLQGYSADQIKTAITRELKQISPQGHDAYDPVPPSSLTLEERRSIVESRWVIGPRPGSELKGRLCAKGFKQVTSRDDKYVSTPQSTTLKLIHLISQIHQWRNAQRSRQWSQSSRQLLMRQQHHQADAMTPAQQGQAQEKCGHAVSGSHHGRQQSRSRS